MTTLYISVDPTDYLAPGKDSATNRVKIKRAARLQADSENFNEIVIVDRNHAMIEQVSTSTNIRDKNYVTGYRVKVKPTSVDFRCDHPKHLDQAERHGEVISATNDLLEIFVPFPDKLYNLHNDANFKIVRFETVWS